MKLKKKQWKQKEGSGEEDTKDVRAYENSGRWRNREDVICHQLGKMTFGEEKWVNSVKIFERVVRTWLHKF